MSLYDEINKMRGRRMQPGGSGVNTARAANCLLKHRGTKGKVTYFGALGLD